MRSLERPVLTEMFVKADKARYLSSYACGNRTKNTLIKGLIVTQYSFVCIIYLFLHVSLIKIANISTTPSCFKIIRLESYQCGVHKPLVVKS